jgi:signal transduction histidine kinase
MSDFEESYHGDPENPSTAFKISLVSEDRRLLELCQEAVQELAIGASDIVLLTPQQAHSSTSELLIWDTDYAISSRKDRALEAGRCQQELFLVNRKLLHEFLTDMPLGAGSTLLKPVTKRVLQIFLEQAFARTQARNKPSAPDWKDALQCLLMANLKMQEYDQDRTNFLARALHDFRSPLMAASGYCNILIQQSMGQLSPGQLDLIQRIQRSLRKLTRLTAGMLRLSVVKQVTQQLDLRDSSLQCCVENALQEIESLAHDKNISISCDLSDPHDPLYVDPEQLEHVMINLLENACRFTPKGGRIEICGYTVGGEDAEESRDKPRSAPDFYASLSSSSRLYRVDMSDTGPGILPENLEKVFEEYTSYGGPRDRSGGGLGLAICKMILTAHGGQIWAENFSAGARLSFILPTGKLLSKRTEAANKELIAMAKKACS